jgi:UDP-glucose 4-epimerase
MLPLEAHFLALHRDEMRLLVTGGTGFAGRALIRYVQARRRGAAITAVSRTATVLPGAEQVVTGHVGDLVHRAEFRGALARSDALVHLGDGLSILQRARHAGDAARADRLVAASADLASAARAAQVPRFIYVSSIKALCDEHDERILVEGSQPQGSTLYGRSKLRIEAALGRILEGSATRLVIVRSPVLYGAGTAGTFDRLLRLADTPFPLPLAGLGNRRSTLAACNLASILTLLAEGAERGQDGVFHVHDGPPLSLQEMVATLRAALGRAPRLFPIGRTARTMLTRTPVIASLMRRLYGPLELSDAHFRRCFSWTPVVDTRTALAQMARSPSGRLPTYAP